MVLLFADILFTLLHLAIIGFNLFGWVPLKTRRLHLVSVGLTAASWLILGIWYGLGYCPITDWQWRIKEQRGITDLPASFITWAVNKIPGVTVSDALVNTATAIVFALVALLSLVANRKLLMQPSRSRE